MSGGRPRTANPSRLPVPNRPPSPPSSRGPVLQVRRGGKSKMRLRRRSRTCPLTLNLSHPTPEAPHARRQPHPLLRLPRRPPDDVLPRQRMGHPRPRRPQAVRVPMPGEHAVRPLLEDHPRQAGELPQSLLRLRPREGRRLHRSRHRAPDVRRGHRPQPAQNRGHTSTTPDASWRSRRSSAPSTATSGSSRATRPCAGTTSKPPPRPQSQRPCPKTSAPGASSSWAPSSSTPTCRPPARSTTTTPRASARPNRRIRNARQHTFIHRAGWTGPHIRG